MQGPKTSTASRSLSGDTGEAAIDLVDELVAAGQRDHRRHDAQDHHHEVGLAQVVEAVLVVRNTRGDREVRQRGEGLRQGGGGALVVADGNLPTDAWPLLLAEAPTSRSSWPSPSQSPAESEEPRPSADEPERTRSAADRATVPVAGPATT